MIWIVLAAGLGVANFIIVALLFRQLRNNLNWQLSSMRAERNSEWIMDALKEAGAPDERQSTAQAVNGNGFEAPPAGPQPVRRKRHLGLFLGGGLAAAFAAVQEAFSAARKTRHGQVAASAVGLTAAATATALLVAAPWHHPHQQPSSAPTVTITATGPTSTAPPGSPTASTKPHPGATVEASASPPPSTTRARGNPLTPISQPTGLPPHPPSSGTPGAPTPAPPGQGSSPPAPPAPPPPSATSTPAPPPAAGGLCLALDLDPLLAVRLCPLGGG